MSRQDMIKKALLLNNVNEKFKRIRRRIEKV